MFFGVGLGGYTQLAFMHTCLESGVLKDSTTELGCHRRWVGSMVAQESKFISRQHFHFEIDIFFANPETNFFGNLSVVLWNWAILSRERWWAMLSQFTGSGTPHALEIMDVSGQIVHTPTDDSVSHPPTTNLYREPTRRPDSTSVSLDREKR